MKSASRTLRDAGSDYHLHEDELRIASLWRTAHIEPITELFSRMTLASEGVEGRLVISRLKRIDTIIRKLRRSDLHVKLHNMADIAGCRVILPDMETVYKVAESLSKYPDLENRRTKDYVSNPKEDGYRGIHLVYKIPSQAHLGRSFYAEAQIRTKSMHAWAVAVEMYGNISGHRIKLGEGTEKERRFFKLLSCLIKAKEERSCMDDLNSVLDEVTALEAELNIIELLRSSYDSMFLIVSEEEKAENGYCLVSADYADQTVKIDVYDAEDAEAASKRYAENERNNRELQDSLLAKAPGIDALKLALPNYFSDLSQFLELIGDIHL